MDITTDKTSLSVLTYNVWFGEHNFDDRVRAIIQIVLDSDADVVCLQEVTGNFLKMFLRNDTILQRYYLSGNGIRGYGVCVLTKFPCHFAETGLESHMGRSLLMAESRINGQAVLLCTAHLGEWI